MMKRLLAIITALCLVLSTAGSPIAEARGQRGAQYAKDGREVLEKTITCSDDSTYTIQATYKNTSGIPMSGAELSVEEILPGDSRYEDYLGASAAKVGINSDDIGFSRVFDIQIVDAADHSIVYEPEGGVDVRITLTGSSLEDYQKVDVLHFTEDESVEESTVENMDSTVSDETVLFTTESFSVYVVIGHEGGSAEVPRVEFHYISPSSTESGNSYTAGPYLFENHSAENGQSDDNYFWTQIVKDGEKLAYVPTPSDLENSHFIGWYVVNCSSDTVTTNGRNGTYTYTWPKNAVRQTFDTTVSVTASGTTVSYTIDGVTYSGTADSEGCLHVYLAPSYTNYRFVDFNDYDGNLVARKLLVLDSNGEATVCFSDAVAVNPDSDHYFMGWSTVNGRVETPTVAETFYIYRDGYIVDTYVTFKENSDGTFAFYDGDSASGTPRIASYAPETEDGDILLYGLFEEAHWLRFVAGETGWGALYVPADYLVGNSPASNLPTTTRVGYRFSGWWTGWQDENTGTIYYISQVTDENGHILSSANATLIDNREDGDLTVNGTSSNGNTASTNAVATGSISGGELTMDNHSHLFAKWAPNDTAEYTVVIWKQKVTDSVDADYTPVQYAAWEKAYRDANPRATDEQVAAAWAATGHTIKTYDYYLAEVRTCQNTSVAVGSTSADRGMSFEGFRLAPGVTQSGTTWASYDVDALVDPQGTTVFNVYYDRNQHTFRFQDNYVATTTNGNSLYGKLENTSYFALTRANYSNTYTYYEYTVVANPSTSGTYYGIVNDYVELTWRNNGWYYVNGYNYVQYTGNIYTRTNRTYTGTRYTQSNTWTTVKEIKALYGQDISSYFPIQGTNGISYSHGERWEDTGNTYDEVVVLINQVPDADVTFHLDVAVRDTKTYNYYVEALDPDEVVRTWNGVGYKLFSSVTVNVHYASNEDFIDIYGYDKVGTDPEFDSNGRIYNTVVNFYYNRAEYELTFNMNYPGGATFESSGGATEEPTVISGIPYGKVLSEYASTQIPAVPDHYVFDGWYEDESGTVPFDFDEPNGIQGSKIIYAKWYPVYYLIEIDPAGGALAGPDVTNQSSYFWLQYGTTVGRYDTIRNFIEVDQNDSEVAADIQSNPDNYFYYRNVNFNGFEHSRWSGNNVADLYYVNPDDAAAVAAEKDNEGIRPSFDRLAEYVSIADYQGANDTFFRYLADHMQPNSEYATESTPEYWDSFYVDTTHVYRRMNNDDPTYALVGWYQNGQPYDFSSEVTAPVKLTAVWRQSGKYHIHYSPNMTEQVNGTSVFGTLTNAAVDPVDLTEGYADGADAVIGTAPKDITGGSGDGNVYLFEGWRVVNENGEPLDEQGNVITSGTGTLYQPGDIFIVHNAQAIGNEIHLEAYYSNVTDSRRRPNVVNLVLDANVDFFGKLVPSTSSIWTWVKPGTLQADTDASQILFGDTQSNVAVHLANFIDSFENTNHYFLLGFDEGSDIEHAFSEGTNATGLRSGAPFVASYAADAVIGIDLQEPYPNVLYAVWEPMVYVTFVNDTLVDLTLSLDVTGDQTLSVVNEVNGVYDREPVAGNTVTVPAGEQVKLVLPYGQAEQLTATTVNNHQGYRLSVSSEFAGNDDEAATSVEGSQLVEYQGTATIQDTLHYDAVGIIVTYTEEVTPNVYYDVNDGTWNETNTGDDADSQYVQDADDTDVYSLSADAIDLLGNYKPTDPSRNGYVFLGWTIYPAIAEHTDFSGTAQVAWGSGDDAVTITPDEGSNILAKIKSDYLWNFDAEPPYGSTLYAVWSDSVTVRFDISYSNTQNHTWTDQSGLYTGSGATRTIVIAKGDTVPKPTDPTTTRITNASFLYWVYNPNTPGTANHNNRSSAVMPSAIPAANIFDFASPVTVDTTLATSWTGASSIPVTVTKQVSDVLNDTTKTFDFTYTIKTYYYTNNNTSTAQLDREMSSEFTLADGESEEIILHYWTDSSNYRFYFETLEVAEKDYTEEFELQIGSLENATAEDGTVTVDPFTGKMSYTSTNNRRYYRYMSEARYYRVGYNSWYNGTGNNPGSASAPVTSAAAVFTNTRKTKTVTVTKVVDGRDVGDVFLFTAMVKFNGEVVTAYSDNEFTEGVRSFPLSNGDSVELIVPYGCTLVVEEPKDFNYEAAVTSDQYVDTDTTDESFTIESVEEDGELLFTNAVKSVIAPTDVDFRWTPYLLMLLLGAVLVGGMYMLKPRKREEE